MYSLNFRNRAWEEIQTSSRWRYVAYRLLFCTLSQRILNSPMRLHGLVPLCLFYRWGNRFGEVRRCAQGPTGGSGLPSPSPGLSFSPLHRAASQLGKTSRKNHTPPLKTQTTFYIFLSLTSNTHGMFLSFHRNGINLRLFYILNCLLVCSFS